MLDKTMEAAPHKEVPPRREEPEKHSSHRGLWLLVIAVLIGGGIFAWRSTHKPQTTAAAGPQGRNRGGAGGGGAVPVVVATAQRQDLPVYLDGLGSVAALNTVTVKSRVDGELMEIHFQEGQNVRRGELLAVIDPRPFQVALAQAQANLARDQAQLTDAKLNADRYAELVKAGVMSQQQSDTQGALAAQLTGALAADQAQIDSAKLNITYSQVTSPLDGRIGLRLVDQGNIVHAADPNGLLVITQMQPISAIFTLPEDNLPAVNARMRTGVPLQVIAMSRDSDIQLGTGTLLTIDNQIDQTTGTFRLKATFENKDLSLWPNQFINARLLVEVQKNDTVIPAAAVQTGAQGTYVYAVKSDGTVEVRPVKVGITQGTVVSIESGLAPSEVVVTDGQDRLRAGIAVDARQDSGSNVGAAGRGGTRAGASSDGAGGRPGGQGQPQGNGVPKGAGSQRNGAPRAGGGAQYGGQPGGGQGFRQRDGGAAKQPKAQ